MLVIGLGLNISNIISLIGSWGFLALILFVAGSLAIGFITGGRNPATRSVMGLGTAQRNVAAAILVTSLNFSGTMTLPFVLVASFTLPLILIPTGAPGEGKSGSGCTARSCCLTIAPCRAISMFR